MVKRDVHDVLPKAIVQGIGGLAVALLGARLRRRGRDARQAANDAEVAS
ncbi:MAG: hypothetical protein GY711_04590 [bacterium]|nr:hypothetical protein [bacterium]